MQCRPLRAPDRAILYQSTRVEKINAELLFYAAFSSKYDIKDIVHTYFSMCGKQEVSCLPPRDELGARDSVKELHHE